MSVRLFAAVFAVVFSLILLLTAGAVAVRLALVDKTPRAQRVEAALEATLGRDIRLSGVALTRFHPQKGPALTVAKLTVPAGGGFDRPLAVARDVRIRFGWAETVLGRQAPPRAVRVGELALNLAWREGGRTSWQAPAELGSPSGTWPAGLGVTVGGGEVRLAPPAGQAMTWPLRQARLLGRAPGLSGQSLWRVTAQLQPEAGKPWGVRLGFASPGQLVAGRPGQLELRLTRAAARLSAFGQVSGLAAGPGAASFDGEVSATGDNLARHWPFEVPAAESVPDLPFRLSAKLETRSDGLGLRNIALRAGGARAIGRASLQTARPAGPPKLSGQVFVDHFDLAGLSARWRDFWADVSRDGPALDLSVEAGALWAGPLKIAGQSQVELINGAAAPLAVRARSRAPQALRPASRRRPQRDSAGPPRPRRPASAGTVALAWERLLQEPQAGLAAPDCLAARLRFRAGTAFLHGVLDSSDGRRIVAGQARARGPDLTVKQRRDGRRQAWHIGGAWDGPRLTRVPQPDSGPAGGLRVPQGGDCTGALAELAPGGD